MSRDWSHQDTGQQLRNIWFQLDGRTEVGDGRFELALDCIGISAISKHGGVIRIQVDCCIKIGDRLVEGALRAIDNPTVVTGLRAIRLEPYYLVIILDRAIKIQLGAVHAGNLRNGPHAARCQLTRRAEPADSWRRLLN